MIITTLNNKEEEVVYQRMKETAVEECKEYVLKFNDCSRNKTITSGIFCKSFIKEMNDCILPKTSPSKLLELKLIEIEKKNKYCIEHQKYPLI